MGWHAARDADNLVPPPDPSRPTTQVRREIHWGLTDARRREERACPELIRRRRYRVVLRISKGGRWSEKRHHVCERVASTNTTSKSCFANIPISSLHLSLDSFAHPSCHASIRGQPAGSRLLQPFQSGRTRTAFSTPRTPAALLTQAGRQTSITCGEKKNAEEKKQTRNCIVHHHSLRTRGFRLQNRVGQAFLQNLPL